MENTELARRVLASAKADPYFSMMNWRKCLAGITLRESGYTLTSLAWNVFTAPDGTELYAPGAGSVARELLGFTDAEARELPFESELDTNRALATFSRLIAESEASHSESEASRS